MQWKQAIVFGSPSAKGYEVRFTKPFGEKLHIPDPFGCPLDTTGGCPLDTTGFQVLEEKPEEQEEA